MSSATVPDEVVKAQADVDAARQAMDASKKVLDSREQLYKEGALARRLVDEASVSYAQARSQYETAQSHLQSLQKVGRHEEVKAAAGQMESAKGRYEAAQAQMGYSEVRSPIAGVVADRPLFAGETANTGSPLLTDRRCLQRDRARQRAAGASRVRKGRAVRDRKRYGQFLGRAGQGDRGQPRGGSSKHDGGDMGSGRRTPARSSGRAVPCTFPLLRARSRMRWLCPRPRSCRRRKAGLKWRWLAPTRWRTPSR